MDSNSNNSTPADLDKIAAWVDDMRYWPNVMYGDIYNYLISSKTVDGQEMKNFKSLQSYNFFQSGNVGQIVQHMYDKEIMLKTFVRASQNITRNNEVYVLCQQDGTIVKGWCSCMAGQGHSCSHVGALLWEIEHAVRNNYTGISCTDESAVWNRGTKRNIEPRSLNSIQFKKPKVGNDILEADDVNSLPGTRNFPTYLSHAEYKDSIKHSHLLPLFSIKGTTAYKSFMCVPIMKETVQQAHGNHSSLTSCNKCSDFLKKFVIVNSEKINKFQEYTKAQSTNAVWRDARKIRITASSAHKIPIKESTDATNFIREHLHPKFIGNKFTRYGLEQEPRAIDFLKSIGHHVQNKGMFISAEENWLSASPDGIIKSDTLLEIKSPFPSNWSNLDEFIADGKYDVIKTLDNTYELKVKGSRGFYMQIQLTLYYANLKKCVLLIWKSACDNIIVNVNYDETYVHEIIQRLRTFYVMKMMNVIVDELENDRLVLCKVFKSFMQ